MLGLLDLKKKRLEIEKLAKVYAAEYVEKQHDFARKYEQALAHALAALKEIRTTTTNFDVHKLAGITLAEISAHLEAK